MLPRLSSSSSYSSHLCLLTPWYLFYFLFNFLSLLFLTRNTFFNFTCSLKVTLRLVIFNLLFIYHLANQSWSQQPPPSSKSSIMVIYLWNNFLHALPKGLSYFDPYLLYKVLQFTISTPSLQTITHLLLQC